MTAWCAMELNTAVITPTNSTVLVSIFPVFNRNAALVEVLFHGALWLFTVIDELLGSFFALGLGGMVMSSMACIAGCAGLWTVVGALTCCKKCCVKCCCCWPCCKKCKGQGFYLNFSMQRLKNAQNKPYIILSF